MALEQENNRLHQGIPVIFVSILLGNLLGSPNPHIELTKT